MSRPWVLAHTVAVLLLLVGSLYWLFRGVFAPFPDCLGLFLLGGIHYAAARMWREWLETHYPVEANKR